MSDELSLGTVIYLAVKPILKIYLILVLGYLLAVKNILTVEGTRTISDIILTVLLPSLIFNKIVSNLQSSDINNVGLICLSSVVIFATGGLMSLLTRFITPSPRRWLGGLLACGIFPNISDIPIAFLQSMDNKLIFNEPNGEKGVSYVMIFLTMFTICLFNFGGFRLIEMDFLNDKKLKEYDLEGGHNDIEPVPTDLERQGLLDEDLVDESEEKMSKAALEISEKNDAEGEDSHNFGAQLPPRLSLIRESPSSSDSPFTIEELYSTGDSMEVLNSLIGNRRRRDTHPSLNTGNVHGFDQRLQSAIWYGVDGSTSAAASKVQQEEIMAQPSAIDCESSHFNPKLKCSTTGLRRSASLTSNTRGRGACASAPPPAHRPGVMELRLTAPTQDMSVVIHQYSHDNDAASEPQPVSKTTKLTPVLPASDTASTRASHSPESLEKVDSDEDIVVRPLVTATPLTVHTKPATAATGVIASAIATASDIAVVAASAIGTAVGIATDTAVSTAIVTDAAAASTAAAPTVATDGTPSAAIKRIDKVTLTKIMTTDVGLTSEDVVGRKHNKFVASILFFLKNCLRPCALATILGMIIAFCPWLKSLFVVSGPYAPLAPDNLPIFHIFIDCTGYVGAASVPFALMVLGSCISRLDYRTAPKGFWKTAVVMVFFRLCILPVIGVLWVNLLVYVGWIDAENKILQFVVIISFSLPSMTSQVFFTAFYTDSDCTDTFQINCISFYMVVQYLFLFISLPIVATYVIKVQIKS
ncbi:hypothetical protein WICPIJ_002858 [Wickerhamomyces pijperi]|uniref:Auxin efflux carrier n=1 Tax=Wickerhamomyces pijperi TaxID=599730 RepID=A0A9P8QB15_WICPI|nr:hypothetical protein WICPIJ_002858 [Wickerhamomyces pijperi]